MALSVPIAVPVALSRRSAQPRQNRDFDSIRLLNNWPLVGADGAAA